MTIAKTLAVLVLSAASALAGAGEIKSYDQATFDRLTHAAKPVLLAVHASWCPTCKAQKPIVAALMAKPAYKDVTTLMIDFDADKALLKTYRVGMQSTLIAFKGPVEVGRSVGDTTADGIEALVSKSVR